MRDEDLLTKEEISEFWDVLSGKGIDEVLERQIVRVGNSAKVAIPPKHIGKVAKIIIKKNEMER